MCLKASWIARLLFFAVTAAGFLGKVHGRKKTATGDPGHMGMIAGYSEHGNVPAEPQLFQLFSPEVGGL